MNTFPMGLNMDLPPLTEPIKLALLGLKDWGILHPILVHFPIALFTVAPLFMLLALLNQKDRPAYLHSGFLLLMIGTIFTYLAYAAGEMASEHIQRTPQALQTLNLHDQLAGWTRTVFSGLTLVYAFGLFLSVPLRTLIPPRMKALMFWLFAFAYLGGLVILINAAHQGGLIVHQHKAHQLLPADL